MANEVILTIKGKDETAQAFNSAKKGLDGLKGAFADVGKVAAGFLSANIIASGANALKGQISSVFQEARNAIEVGKQTAAVLKSTGGVAGVTATQVSDLATSLSQVTNFSDDTVQSAENLLLTFTSIGKDVFPQATETVLDMAQALGEDTKSAAIQLGKAMNDPITGATALRRVGVALTEQQLKQIKVFQESGDLLSAQKIIMKELATEFGGSARATADPLKVLSNSFKNLKEQLGLALLPAFLAFAKVMSQHVVPALSAGITHLTTFVRLIKAALTGDVGKAAELFNELPKPLQALALWLGKNKEEIIGFLKGVKEVAEAIGTAVVEFAKWTKESGLLDTALVGIKTIAEGIRATLIILAPIVQRIAKFFQEHKTAAIALGIALGAVAIALFPIPAAILAVVLAVGVLRKHWDDIKAKTIEVWNAIPTPIQDALKLIVDIVKIAFETVKNEIETAFNVIRDVIRIATALWKGDWGAAWEGLKQLGLDIFDGFVTDITLKLSGLGRVFSFVFDGLKGIVSSAFESMKQAGINALNFLIDKLNDVIGVLNKAIDAFNKLPGGDIPNIPTVPGITQPGPTGPGTTPTNILPGLPQFAHGTAFVPRDMLAQLHRGEAVIPANQNHGNTISVEINIENMESGSEGRFARAVREELQSLLYGASPGGFQINTAPFAP